MKQNQILAKYEISQGFLESFIKQWACNYNDVSYFLNEGYLCWVAWIMDSAGLLEEGDDDPCILCLRELARLPEAQSERDEGVSLAYISICPSCNAHHFMNHYDFMEISSEVYTTCFQNGCKGKMKVTRPSSNSLLIRR